MVVMTLDKHRETIKDACSTVKINNLVGQSSLIDNQSTLVIKNDVFSYFLAQDLLYIN